MPDFLLRMWRKPLKSIIVLLQVLAGMAVTLLAIQVSQDDLGFGRSAQENRPFELIAGSKKESGYITYGLFTSKDFPKIKKLSPAVDDVAIRGWKHVREVVKGSTKFNIVNTKTTTPNYQEFAKLKILHGQYFTQKSREKGNEVVVSKSTSKVLFSTDQSVGKTFKTLEYGGSGGQKKYKVVGVVEDAPLDKFNVAASIYFPESLDKKRRGSSDLLVLAKKGKRIEAKKQVKKAVKEIYAKNNTFIQNKKALYIEDRQERTSKDPPTFFILAALSLVLTAIALLASQLMNVRERTREIGMKRALGATQGRIARDFLTESLLLTFMGGLLGLGVAFLCWSPLQEALSLRDAFSWPLAFMVFGSLLIAALLFSLYPALMAARLRPSEAAKAVGS